MFYPNLRFPKFKNRPFFYANFVASVDGKVQVTKNPKTYWPLGSEFDHQVLTELRSYADVLIHGKNTALSFSTFKNFNKQSFSANKNLIYMVISNNHDEELLKNLKNKKVKTYLVTHQSANISQKYLNLINILKLGKDMVDLRLLVNHFNKEGLKNILLEGGPNLMGSFFKENLVDEIFLTIAPKIIGNQRNSTLTMVEGFMFKPEKVKKLKLISVKEVKNELFLRYQVV